MSEEDVKQPTDDPEGGALRSVPASGTRVSERQREALLRALSGLDAVKRNAEPEAAEEAVSRHLDRHTKNLPLPTLIARFMDTHWRSYMVRLYLAEGDESDAWKGALEKTECLLWSLQPKEDDTSRQRLYVLLPDLFQWLHAVLRSQRIPDSEEDAFFAELARLQVAALHPAPESTPDAEQEAAADVADPDQTADPAGSSLGIEPAVDESEGAQDPLQALVIGRTVEFQSDRATKRILRLEWISRGGGVYMFRDQRRGDSLCLTAERCVECFRDRSFNLLR